MKQMIALGRVGAPEEAAGAMLLLASPYASYITGQVRCSGVHRCEGGKGHP